jgi:hypothetical protein
MSALRAIFMLSAGASGGVACGPDPAGTAARPTERAATDIAAAPGAPGMAEDRPDLVLLGVAGLRSDPGARADAAFLAPLLDGPPAASGPPVAALRFSRAYAQSPATFVSLASLMGGRYPSALPICGFPSEPWEATTEAPWCTSFPSTTPSLPTVLRAYGYRTALVVSEIQGADRFAEQFDELIIVGERFQSSAADWGALETAAGGWWRADPSRPRLLVVLTSDLNVRTRPELRAAWGLTDLDAGPDAAPPALDSILAGYRAEAAAVGQRAADLLGRLDGDSRPPRPRWTALMGLHGINLGETPERTQALRDRSWSDILIDRTLHVPLAVLGPQGALQARTEDQIVELVDVLPTLLAIAGAVPPAGASGQDLRRLPPPPPPGSPGEPTAYAELGDMLSLRRGQRMWSIRAFHFNRSALDPELTDFAVAYQPSPRTGWLHDLAADPFQQNNLVQRDPAGAAAMHAAMVALRTGPAAPPAGALDARKIWALRMAPADGYW